MTILEFGAVAPVLSLVVGLHGDETSSLRVIDRLLLRLPRVSCGTLRIVFANPLALAQDRRAAFQDGLDINRVMPGDPSKSVTHRTARTLLQTLADSAAVIDLHNFDMRTPLMGIIVCPASGPPARSLSLMQAFRPAQCWLLQPGEGRERRFEGSLGVALNDLEIPNIAVELDSPELVSSEQLDACVEGLLRVIADAGMVDRSEEQLEAPLSRTFPLLSRTVIAAEGSGIFLCAVHLGDAVMPGQPLGVIRTIPEFTDIPIPAPSGGVIMQLLPERFVLPGQELVAIGERMEE